MKILGVEAQMVGQLFLTASMIVARKGAAKGMLPGAGFAGAGAGGRVMLNLLATW
jgi:hypothetical protein